MSSRKLILCNTQSPGDIVMLTAAIRDLHLAYPGEFVTDVRTSSPALWENNPYLTPLDESDPDVTVLECEYPLIHRSNDAPYHFIHGFIENLNDRLDLSIRPTQFRGDIHVSPLEKSWFSQIEELVHEPVPFWIVAAGGKHDYTIKWWDRARFQQVVDHFRGRVLFVQVGEAGHVHPPLENVVDLRSKTDLRQLVRLMYHAQGVLCPVTLFMHLAAATETRPEMPRNRPCVVVAGGREPPHWEAYPHHQFIHRAGSLRCCEHGGCWRSRAVPLGDGDEKDLPEHRCVDLVGALPRCMDLITAEDVIRAIEVYFEGGAVSYLTPLQQSAIARARAVNGEW
jgi:ADP-heptose:LPS heptosyltransferase